MSFDVFVLILDNESRYVKGKLSYDSAIAANTEPDSTVIVISANQTVERLIVGADASTITPPLPPLTNRTPKPGSRDDSTSNVISWIYEVSNDREADGRSAKSIGVLADFDPIRYQSLLTALRDARNFTLVDETTTRPQPKPASVKPVAKPQLPKSRSANRQVAPKVAPNPTDSSTSKAKSTAPTTPPRPVSSSNKKSNPLKVVLPTLGVIAVAAFFYGETVLGLFAGFTGGAVQNEATAIVIPTQETTNEPVIETIPTHPVEPESEDTEPEDRPELEHTDPPETAATESQLQAGERYFDLGGDVDLSFRRFDETVDTSHMSMSCDLGGYSDWTMRAPQPQTESEFSTISLPVVQHVAVTVKLCIEAGDPSTVWSIWLGGLPPAEAGCQTFNFTKPAGTESGALVVTLEIPAECVHRDTLMLVFIDVAAGQNGVWGVYTYQAP